MNEQIVLTILDAALSAFEVGIERDAIVDHFRAEAAKGATGEQIAAGIAAMRDAKIDEAQAKIDAARGG